MSTHLFVFLAPTSIDCIMSETLRSLQLGPAFFLSCIKHLGAFYKAFLQSANKTKYHFILHNSTM